MTPADDAAPGTGYAALLVAHLDFTNAPRGLTQAYQDAIRSALQREHPRLNQTLLRSRRGKASGLRTLIVYGSSSGGVPLLNPLGPSLLDFWITLCPKCLLDQLSPFTKRRIIAVYFWPCEIHGPGDAELGSNPRQWNKACNFPVYDPYCSLLLRIDDDVMRPEITVPEVAG